ncbi:hypothetical protein HII36_25850 [Nonomuraea sp. NN258]|uniref:hypothetical protein n=1 Tax=Nonomuraea antri TaxID=2730852 RepID=UPI001568DC18|nr:hypothetical protein [Nonomuraea antri]NRQ35223.1 hypothetical protein [Nonomuraea antri]
MKRSRTRRGSARSFVLLGWLFLIAAVALVLNSAWDVVIAPVIALVGLGLGSLVTSVVLAIEDLTRAQP